MKLGKAANISLVFLLLIVIALVIVVVVDGNTDNTPALGNDFTPYNETSSYTPKSTSPSKTYKSGNSSSLIDSQKEKIQTAIDTAKRDGLGLVFTEGYSFDCCVEAATEFMSENYNESFYKTSVFATTSDLKIYDFAGYTKTGKSFYLSIFHYDEVTPGKWVVVDSYCK